MERNFICISSVSDPYENIGADEWFLDHVGEEDLVLYFYRNDPSVIIGKNQNPWVECDLAKMESDGVSLVRRVSGGGAVFHDSGNLNFSFIAGKQRYDLAKQMSVILKAVQSLGISCEFSGRNDLISGGKKFSGNAFAARKENRLHHGTLLISSDLDRLRQYLTPDEKKIRSKGIASVRSRVCNLCEQIPDLEAKSVRGAISKQFEKTYGYFGEWQFHAGEREEVRRYREKHASSQWYLGETPKFDLEWEDRFSWGGIRLLLSFRKGVISSVSAFSDAMDPEICEKIQQCLLGLPFHQEKIATALAASDCEELRELSKSSFIC